MGFSGGGSNVLKPHKHSSAVQDGSPLNMNNVTEATLTAGDIVYSDGVALQRLAIGSTAEALVVSGGVPTWGAATSNPLIKVTKTFADIVVGTTSMDIYTLPQDAALCNIYTDITTVFDLSTAVTIGDAGDDNGFQEATDWTSGTGLTSATRGTYVTSFKTMRSTSGTTAIKAYGFATTGGGGTVFSQPLTGTGRGLSNSPRQEMAQQFNAGHVLVGEDICHASFFIDNDSGSPTGTLRSFIRQSDGTLIQESSTTLDASTLTGTSTEYSFAFPNVTLSAGDMITISAAGITGSTSIEVNLAEMTNGKLYDTATTGSSYSQMTTQQMQMTVTYACSPVTSDTQGEVDFYLQVVD
jgi:hypothetical protein